MTRLSISVLGPFQASLNGKDITKVFRTRKERALLAYLAIESKRTHRREVLAELLWPDRPEGSSRVNLRQALYGIRHAIANGKDSPPIIEMNDESVRIDPNGDYWLDINSFSSRLQSINQHPHRELSTCIICTQNIHDALDLYRGAFLEDLTLYSNQTFQEWLVFHQEHYYRAMIDALQHLANYYQHLGDYERAKQYAWQRVKRSPLDEDAHRQIMHLLYLSGQRSAALEQYQVLHRTLAQELGIEPVEETNSLYENIRADKNLYSSGSRLENPPPSNIPSPLTSFIDREDETNWLLSSMSNPSCRLVNITGMTGIGKTRLVTEAATQMSGIFPDGTWMISLDAIHSPDLLIPSIIQTIGLPVHSKGSSKSQLINHLYSLSSLLIFDNFDHLIDSTPLLLDILKQTPHTKIIVTSKEKLPYQAAYTYDVKGLRYPEDHRAKDPLDYPAVQLFLNRGQYQDINDNDPDLNSILDICKSVGGLPLGIELAAANLEDYEPSEIAQHLKTNLDILTTSLIDIPKKHQSIQAAFQQSWDNLNEEEQALYRKLAIFSGNFSTRAASEITGISLRQLRKFSRKSLIEAAASRLFRIQPLLRVFLFQKLGEDPQEIASLKEAHSQFYSDFLANNEDALLNKDLIQKKAASFQDEMENILLSWKYSIASGNYRILMNGINTWFLFCDITSQIQLGLFSFGEIIDGLDPDGETRDERVLYAICLAMKAWFNSRTGSYTESINELKTSRQILISEDAVDELGFIEYALGVVLKKTGDFQNSIKHFNESLKIIETKGNWIGRLHPELMLLETQMELNEIENLETPLVKLHDEFVIQQDFRGTLRSKIALAQLMEQKGKTSVAENYQFEAEALMLFEANQWVSKNLLPWILD